MQVFLEIDGGVDPWRALVRQGQTASIGRTEWADFSVPSDGSLREVHFEVTCGSGYCECRTVDGAGPLLINGEPAEQAAVQHGDRIQAGGTTFRVHVMSSRADDANTDADASAPAPSAEPDSDVESQAPNAAELCLPLELSDEARGELQTDQAADAYYELLKAKGLLADAVKLMGQWLSKPSAVQWAIDCFELGGGLPVDDREASAIEAARAWIGEASEENRLTAQHYAEDLEYATAPSWLAAAAAWSSGSMAPPDLPEAPAPAHLTGVVASSVVLTSIGDAADEPVDAKLTRFLKLADALRDKA